MLGAAKSGTTFLHRELSRHADVFMSGVKEPTFFTNTFHVVKSPVEYADLFAPAGDEVWVGESSHAYLSHPESLRTVATFLDPQRFIVTLRDPIQRARSMFNHQSRQGREWCLTFEGGLREEPRRMRSERLRLSRYNSYMNFGYVTSGNYAEQLEPYFDMFGRDRFHVVFFEELVADTDAMMRGVWEFLGLDPLPADTAPANPGGVMSRFAPVSLGLWAASRATSGRLSLRFKDGYDNFRKPAPPLRAETAEELATRFRPSVDRLEDLLGRAVPWAWYRES